MLKDGFFAIQNDRFGAFFTQLLPLAGYKAGLRLELIALLYSLSFVLLPLASFLFIDRVLKDSRTSLAYLMSLVIMTTHTFYWIQSELPQALAFLFIFVAYLERALRDDTISPVFLPVSSLLLLLVCFTHPLTIVPFAFVISYYLLKYPVRYRIILFLALGFIGQYGIRSLFFRTDYDSQAISVLQNILVYFPNYHDLQSNRNFLHYLAEDYQVFLLVFLAVCITLYLKRNMRLLICVLIFMLGHTLMVNVNYPNGADQFYLENQYCILAVMVAMPFVDLVIPSLENVRIQFALIGALCLIGLVRMYMAHEPYSERLEWNRRLLAQSESLPGKKVIIPAGMAPLDTLFMTWGSSYELWLLSTMEGGSSRSIIIEERSNEFDWALPAERSFIVKWGVFDYDELDARYFRFSDNSTYIRLQ